MSIDVPVLRYSTEEPDPRYSVLGGTQIDTNGRFIVRGVHGVGTINGTHFVTNAVDLAKALRLYEEEPEILGGSIRGALTIYVEDLRSKTFFILTDPLGSSIVYSYVKSGEVYCSSSLRNLLGILKNNGIEPRKSLAYAAVLAVTEFGGLIDSPYVDITALEPFHFLEFSKSGVDTKVYPLCDEIFGKIQGYGANIAVMRQQVSADILANLKAASRYQASSHICHVSGDLDERTLLAGLERSGYRQKYTLHTNAALTSEGTLNSRSLAGSLKMKLSRYPGHEIAVKPGNSAEDMRWRFHETFGVLCGPASVGLRRADSVVLAGGFGALLREPIPVSNTVNEKELFDESKLLELCLGEYDGKPGVLRELLGPDLLERCIHKLRDIVKSAKKFCIPNESLPEFLWLYTKGRYIDGESSRSMSEYSHRFDPLYTPWVIPATGNYSREDRRNNFLQLDIIRDLSEELTSLPFNKSVRVDEFFSAHPQIKQRNFQHAQSKLDLHHFSLSALLIQPEQVAILEEHETESRRLGLPARRIAETDEKRQRVLEMILEIESNVIGECFVRDEVVKRFKTRPRWVPQYRLIERIHGGLEWFLE
ncbi:hypothetical protein [Glutamicibacter sp.]|uniref:hypothetical protein n=1 Tax=Glutamicibacter sp. TaxID=1931995 RepID=UPI002FE069C8